MSHLLLLSQAEEQEAELETEQLGCAWKASTAERNLMHYATIPAFTLPPTSIQGFRFSHVTVLLKMSSRQRACCISRGSHLPPHPPQAPKSYGSGNISCMTEGHLRLAPLSHCTSSPPTPHRPSIHQAIVTPAPQVGGPAQGLGSAPKVHKAE